MYQEYVLNISDRKIIYFLQNKASFNLGTFFFIFAGQDEIILLVGFPQTPKKLYPCILKIQHAVPNYCLYTVQQIYLQWYRDTEIVILIHIHW